MPSSPTRIFSFTITLTGVSELTPAMAEAIFAAGCDDATPRSSEGVVTIGFDREAESLGDAISSAIKDVERAGFAVAVVVVEAAAD